MNTKTIFKLGSLVAALGVTTTGRAVPAPIDDFDTFVGAGVGQVGFSLSDNTVGGAVIQDGPDLVPNPADTFAVNMTRRVIVNCTLSNFGNAATVNNTTGAITYSNGSGTQSNVTLTYTLQNPVDLTVLWDRFSFLFLSADFGGSLSVDVTTLAATTATINAVIPPGIAVPTGIQLPFSSAVGTPSALTAAKIVKFTLQPVAADSDWTVDGAFLDNPNIPEASTAIPALAFAGVVGYFGWRRSRAKAA